MSSYKTASSSNKPGRSKTKPGSHSSNARSESSNSREHSPVPEAGILQRHLRRQLSNLSGYGADYSNPQSSAESFSGYPLPAPKNTGSLADRLLEYGFSQLTADEKIGYLQNESTNITDEISKIKNLYSEYCSHFDKDMSLHEHKLKLKHFDTMRSALETQIEAWLEHLYTAAKTSSRSKANAWTTMKETVRYKRGELIANALDARYHCDKLEHGNEKAWEMFQENTAALYVGSTQDGDEPTDPVPNYARTPSPASSSAGPRAERNYAESTGE